MKILHTADWHLGAHLGSFSRTFEQRAFIWQLCELVDAHGVQLVLVAGDVFDVSNPSAQAEQLFYDAMEQLSGRGVQVVVLAGNHDNPERLSAPAPPLKRLGVHIVAYPSESPLEIEIDGETAIIAALPFVSEKRLGERIFKGGEGQSEAQMQRDFSARVGEVYAGMAAHFQEDTVNIAMGHFHIIGGEVSGGIERGVLVGGTFAVNRADLPDAQYIALGHLHRPQKVGENAYYSGSPLPYSLSERHPKAVYIADISAGAKAVVEQVILDCPKPIELWTVATAADALKRLEMPTNAYLYIRITNDLSLNTHDIKQMNSMHDSIVAIELASSHNTPESHEFTETSLSPREEFSDFYANTKGAEPSAELLTVFDEILASMEGGEEL